MGYLRRNMIPVEKMSASEKAESKKLGDIICGASSGPMIDGLQVCNVVDREKCFNDGKKICGNPDNDDPEVEALCNAWREIQPVEGVKHLRDLDGGRLK